MRLVQHSCPLQSLNAQRAHASVKVVGSFWALIPQTSETSSISANGHSDFVDVGGKSVQSFRGGHGWHSTAQTAKKAIVEATHPVREWMPTVPALLHNLQHCVLCWTQHPYCQIVGLYESLSDPGSTLFRDMGRLHLLSPKQLELRSHPAQGSASHLDDPESMAGGPGGWFERPCVKVIQPATTA